MRKKIMLVALVVLPVVLAACASGTNQNAKPNSRGVVEITMRDERFEPDHIEVKAGESVTYRFTNKGALTHEAVIGTEAEQQTHEQEMNHSATTMPMATTMPTTMPASRPMSGDNTPGTTVRVKPGETAELHYTAAKTGTLLIGCHEPGHWAAGMRATITVV